LDGVSGTADNTKIFGDMIPDWAKELNCSITVCDKDGVIVYQNDRAVEQHRKRGDLIGRNLFDCHNESKPPVNPVIEF
jgi:hypothetical protein